MRTRDERGRGRGRSRRRLAAAGIAALAMLGVLASVLAGTASGRAQTAPSLSVRPSISGTPRQGETLTATSGSWAGTTPMVFSYQWRQCNLSGGSCTNIAGANDQTLVLGGAQVGHTVRVLVTASNGSGASSALSLQTQAIVAKGAPLNTADPKISGTTRQADTLTASAGTWSGEQPIKFTYQWLRCNQSGERCGAIGGATDQTYTLVSRDVGHTLRVAVTGSNGAGKSTAHSRPSSVVVAGQAPANTNPPVVSGQNIEGQTLTTSDGSWSGSGTFQFSYQWQRCDASGTNCSFISGATSKTYTLAAADVGHELRSAVTARNGVGRATAYSNATQQVIPRVPTNTALPAISGTPQVGSTLTASNGSWAGPGPISYFYQWARSNSKGGFDPIVGATSQSYTLTSADAGHMIFVQVKAQNSFGAGFADSKGVGPVGAAGQVTIAATQHRVVYGQSLRLFGAVNAGGGTSVQIVAQQSGQPAKVVATTTTTGDHWAVRVHPRANTVYRARANGGSSVATRVLVRPRIRLGAVSRRTLSVRVYSVNQLAGRRVILELRRGHHWRTIGLVRLKATGLGGQPTIVSQTVVRVLIRSHARLRAVMTARQAAPGYIMGISNVIRR